MLDQVKELYANALKHVCMPYYPNQLKLYQMGLKLRKYIKPAREDKFRILRLHVDKDPDFDWPFTIAMPDGSFRYIFINEWHKGIKVLPQMEPFMLWVNLADFDEANYDEVVAGRLSVTGAWDDISRGLTFDYEMLPHTTAHALSFDTHTVLDSSFDTARFVATRDETVMVGTPFEYRVLKNLHPRPFTIIHGKDVWHKTLNPNGLWWPVRNQETTDKHMGMYDYVAKLEASGRKTSVVPKKQLHQLWWKHNTRFTFGAGPEPTVWENIMLHAYTRDREPILFLKGLTDPEYFGIFEPQVVIGGDPFAQPNLEGLQMYTQFDLIIIDGEAASHCVLNTGIQMVDHIGSKDPSQISKLIMVTDGSSNIPGSEADTAAAYKLLEAKGVRRMTYADTLEFVRSKVS